LVLRNEQRLGSRVVRRTAEQLAGRYNPEQIALAIKSSVHESELSSVRDTLLLMRHRADLLWNRPLPNMPTRELLLAEARNMFPRTISLDDIVDGAYRLLVEAVGALLIIPPLWVAATPKPQANTH
jgi:stearoyl-CoA desaturase (delta-9 desaturase)